MTEQGLPCDFCEKNCTSWCKVCGIYYCSRECQVNHWPHHKQICATTFVKRFEKILKADWNSLYDRIIWNKLAITVPRHGKRPTTWSRSSDTGQLMGCCFGCGNTSWGDFYSDQRLINPRTGTEIRGSYCKKCHEETRFIDPNTFLRLRKIWVVFLMCLKHMKPHLGKDVLTVILKHFKIAWEKMANISIIPKYQIYDEMADFDFANLYPSIMK